jgi:hypothetical protein
MIDKINASNNRSMMFILHDTGSSSSDGSGVIADSKSLLLTDLGDYSTYTSFFDEYRMIGGRITFYSRLGPGHTSNCNYAVVAYDKDSASVTPSSALQVSEYSTSGNFNCGRASSYSHTWEVPASQNEWIDCASPATTGCIPFYAESLTASTNYLRWEMEVIVEFRGLRG